MSRPDPARAERLAPLALALAGLPRWSPTRRALEARLAWLRRTETLTGPEVAAEAARMLEAARAWRQLDQTARLEAR